MEGFGRLLSGGDTCAENQRTGRNGEAEGASVRNLVCSRV